MELLRNGLKLVVVQGLDDSEGSVNVPVKLVHNSDDQYVNFTEQVHIRYINGGKAFEEILPSKDSGFYIPGKVFVESGPIQLAVHLINGDVERVTNELQFVVKKAPNGKTLVDPSEFSWQQLVDQYVNAKLDTFADKADMNEFKGDVNANLTNQNSKITTLESRMDTFTKLPEGSTTGDAELQDIRVGANGITYDTAGNAVRGQYSQLKEDLSQFTIVVNSKNLFNGNSRIGYYNTEDGSFIQSSSGYYANVEPIEVMPNTKIYFSNDGIKKNVVVFEYSVDGSFIKYTNASMIVTNDKTKTINFYTSAFENPMVMVSYNANLQYEEYSGKNLYVNPDRIYNKENICVKYGTNSIIVYIKKPTCYIGYEFGFKENESDNYANWRLYGIAAYEKDFTLKEQLTPRNSIEFECAIRLKDAPDFIGGHLHGDEIKKTFSVFADGKPSDGDCNCNTLRIVQTSNLYSPITREKVAEHSKVYDFDSNGMTLSQTVKWLSNQTIDACYLTMFAMLRDVVSKGMQGNDYITYDIPNIGEPSTPLTANVIGNRELFIYGDNHSGKCDILEKTDIEKEKSFADQYKNYSKFYYSFCDSGTPVSNGDLWKNKSRFEVI